jgi:DNA mismatch repair ATPase MutS
MELVKDGENGVKALNMTMNMSQRDNETTPLFALEDGVACSSAGIECARKAGVKESVLTRAREIIVALRDKTHIKPVPEISSNTIGLSDTDIEVVHKLVSIQWADASDDEITNFLSTLKYG